jgi:hypothetical protein
MWQPRRLTTLFVFTACYRVALPFVLHRLCDRLILPKPKLRTEVMQTSLIPNLTQVVKLLTGLVGPIVGE